MQNFVGDDTPLGELVNWINQDSNFPRDVKSQVEVLSYFRNNPCPENIPVTIVKEHWQPIHKCMISNQLSQMYDF